MDQVRRNILLGAGGAFGGVALAAPAAVAAAKKEVTLLSSYVTGTAYYDAGGVASTLRPGEHLALHREHRNDYDPRAIEVRTRSGTKLGYLPRVHNQALASLMDAGFEVSARADEVWPDRQQPEIRVEVVVLL